MKLAGRLNGPILDKYNRYKDTISSAVGESKSESYKQPTLRSLVNIIHFVHKLGKYQFIKDPLSRIRAHPLIVKNIEGVVREVLCALALSGCGYYASTDGYIHQDLLLLALHTVLKEEILIAHTNKAC